MRSVNRLFGLAVRFNLASKAKVILLAVLVAVGMSVFLVVVELSRVSSEDLDEAVSSELGKAGTYSISVTPGSGGLLPGERVYDIVAEALSGYSDEPPTMVEYFPPVTSECPPFENLGPQSMMVLPLERTGREPVGTELPFETELCLASQKIPAGALRLPTQQEMRVWGSGLLIDARYRQVLSLATLGPVHYRFVLVTGREGDEQGAIQTSVEEGFLKAQEFNGELPSVFISHPDIGSETRAATEGVKLVYAIIAWGVMILGGLGLLVAELIAVRQRTWFFGLARAVGARRNQIVLLVIADLILVLGLGVLLALIFTAAVQPVANQFARDAFQVDVHLLQGGSLTRLVGGALLLLLIAGIYPAVVAIRQDPLDVLEPRAF